LIAPPWDPVPLPAHPFGALHAVAIPRTPPPPEVLARLLPEERAHAAGLSAPRLATWVAGRLALGAALASAGAPRVPLLPTSRGAPALPDGFAGSLSHKETIAVALAAPRAGAHLGVDVEVLRPLKVDISRMVLTDAERAAVDAGAGEARWREILIRFSIKESIYKAVDRDVQRYVGFKEAEVDPGPPARARLSLRRGEGPFAVEARWDEIEGLLVTAARVRPAHDAQT
jgi:enterobactin synthetase component D